MSGTTETRLPVADIQPPILVLAALEIERDAFLRHVEGATLSHINGNPVHVGKVGASNAVVVCLRGMGNVNSALGTAQLLADLKPTYVLLVGIAGGANKPGSDGSTLSQRLAAIGGAISSLFSLFSKKPATIPIPQNSDPTRFIERQSPALGDLLIADQVADYQFGKQETNEFIQKTRCFPAAAFLLKHAKELASDPSRWTNGISAQTPDNAPPRVPQIHIGTIVSGELVQKNPAFVTGQKKRWPQLVGIEMEAFGVAMACHNNYPPCDCLVLKAICDWADPGKNDDWRQYAADVSATFAAALIRSLSPSLRKSSQDVNPIFTSEAGTGAPAMTSEQMDQFIEAARRSERSAATIETQSKILKELCSETRWQEAVSVAAELEGALRTIPQIGAHVKKAWIALAMLERHTLLIAAQNGITPDATRLTSLRREAENVKI